VHPDEQEALDGQDRGGETSEVASADSVLMSRRTDQGHARFGAGNQQLNPALSSISELLKVD